MKKIVGIVLAAAILIYGAFLAKGYYNDRYVVADSFYTQVPVDEVNEESWLVDDNGVKQDKGKAYKLIGYNQEGAARELSFIVQGEVEDYYAPGTYLKVNASKTIVLGQEVVKESEVPKVALEKMEDEGTRPK